MVLLDCLLWLTRERPAKDTMWRLYNAWDGMSTMMQLSLVEVRVRPRDHN